MDALLGGGLLASTLTEVAGPPGCGKTQMCTMLAAQAVLPRELGGLGGSVIYIDTEGAFSAERCVRAPGHTVRAGPVRASALRLNAIRPLTGWCRWYKRGTQRVLAVQTRWRRC